MSNQSLIFEISPDAPAEATKFEKIFLSNGRRNFWPQGIKKFLLSSTDNTPFSDPFFKSENKLSLQAGNFKKLFESFARSAKVAEENLSSEAAKRAQIFFDQIPYANSAHQFPVAFRNLLFGFAEANGYDTDGLRSDAMHIDVSGLQKWSPMIIEFILDADEEGEMDLDNEEVVRLYFEALDFACDEGVKIERSSATVFSIHCRHPRGLYKTIENFVEEQECDTLDSSLTWNEVRPPIDLPDLKIKLANDWEHANFTRAQVDRLKAIEAQDKKDLAAQNDPALDKIVEDHILDYMPGKTYLSLGSARLEGRLMAQNFYCGAVSLEALDYAMKLDMGEDFPKGHEPRFIN